MKASVFAIAAFTASVVCSGANAATVTFEGGPPGGTNYTEAGMTFDDVRIVNGQCDSSSGRPCGAINENESSTMTQTGGGLFTVLGFWFQLLGQGTGNTLIVTTDLGVTQYSHPTYDNNNGGQYVDLASNSSFMDINWINFSSSDGGNVRIDDIGIKDPVNPSPVPLPAAGWLLIASLGGLALTRRKS